MAFLESPSQLQTLEYNYSVEHMFFLPPLYYTKYLVDQNKGQQFLKISKYFLFLLL